MASQKKRVQILSIGYQKNGEFGLGHKKTLHIPTPSPNRFYNLTKVHQGGSFIIFTDDKYQHIFSTGKVPGQFSMKKSYKYTPILYFKHHNIKINKICVSLSGTAVFYITQYDNAYCCGNNGNYGLGLGHNDTTSAPELISSLKDVIDIKSTDDYHVALCKRLDDDDVYFTITNWWRFFGKLDDSKMPEDIINIIMMFTLTTSVYSNKSEQIWMEIKKFADKDIMKIACTRKRTFLLEGGGVLWSTPRNMGFDQAEEIKYFIDYNIRIVEICCGSGHILALDENGRVYSWGNNSDGQCGRLDGTGEPRMVEMLKEFEVEVIRAGEYHSYFGSKCGKSFMCGSNDDMECIIKTPMMIAADRGSEYRNGTGASVMMKPKRVDLILKEKYNVECILDVGLGNYNTVIVCTQK